MIEHHGLAEAIESEFRRVVSRAAHERVLPRQTGDVDDVTRASRAEALQGFPRAVENARKVGVDRPLPLLNAQIRCRTEFADPGVIHQHINPVEFLIDKLEQRSNLIWLRNVTNLSHHASSTWRMLLEIGNGPGDSAPIASADPHICARLQHSRRDGAADSLGAAGDDDYLPFQKTFHVLRTRAEALRKQDNSDVGETSSDGARESRLAAMLRPVLPWMTAAIVMAALWTAWVLWNRHNETSEAEQAASERQAENNREILDRLGGDKLTVLSFYASPGAIHRGTHVSLCYGVSNAVSVTIDPDLGVWKPALSRCIDLEPRHTTAYTLTAKNARGQTVTATANVTVE